jgi:hypothetical protein
MFYVFVHFIKYFILGCLRPEVLVRLCAKNTEGIDDIRTGSEAPIDKHVQGNSEWAHGSV